MLLCLSGGTLSYYTFSKLQQIDTLHKATDVIDFKTYERHHQKQQFLVTLHREEVQVFRLRSNLEYTTVSRVSLSNSPYQEAFHILAHKDVFLVTSHLIEQVQTVEVEE